MYKLLIVDDEQTIIDGMKILIDWNKYNVTRIETAASYFEAIQKAIELKPQIAVLDVRIENGWGYEVIEELNRLGMTINYIMISGYDDFEYVRRSLVAGAKEYLLKPVNSQKLEQILEKIIVKELHGELKHTDADKENIDPITHIPYRQYSNIVNKIMIVVKRDYGKKMDLTTIAEMFKMSSKYIGRLFLQETSMKFSEYLFVYRMEKAKEMIENTSEKILYIAQKVGYHHLQYFYRHFKSYFDFSPNDLRKENDEDETALE